MRAGQAVHRIEAASGRIAGKDRTTPAICVERMKQRADEVEYAQLVKDNVPVAPIYSGLDGGMNKVFLARFPGKIVSLAIVLPPGSGSELPQLPAIPWTDNDGSLPNKFFGALWGSNPASQRHVPSTDSTMQGRAADPATTASSVTPTTRPAFPD